MKQIFDLRWALLTKSGVGMNNKNDKKLNFLELILSKPYNKKTMYDEEKIDEEFLKRPENPFRTPEKYFDTLENRIIAGIKQAEKKQSKSSRMVQFLKPALGLVASFTLVYMLVYYPINHFLPTSFVKTTQSDTISSDIPEAYSLSFSLLDESTLLKTISTADTISASRLNPDDVLAYLSAGTNDLELYSEIQN